MMEDCAKRGIKLVISVLCGLIFATFLVPEIMYFTPTQASSQPNTIDPDAYSVSITSSSSIHLNLETVPYTNTIRSAKDTIQATVNAPSTTTNNFKLYLSTDSAESNSLNNGSSSIPATSATPFAASSLTGNSWGFALANTTPGLPSGTTFDETYQEGDPGKDSKWAQVPKKGSEQLIQTLPMNQSPYTTDIYYAISARDNLAEGTYNGTVLYTAIYDAAETHEASLSPEEGTTGTELIITTAAKTDTTADPGAATVDLINTATNTATPCENPTTSVNTNGLIQVTCRVPDLLQVGEYNVSTTLQKFNTTYEAPGNFAFKYTWDTMTTMQQMTPEICASQTTPAASATDAPTRTVKDARDNKEYYISKLADGRCWMTQNLDLNLNAGTLPLTPETSDVSADWNPGSTYYTKTSTSSSTGLTDRYSWDLGNYYHNGTSHSDCGTSATSYANCTTKGFSTTGDQHYHVGTIYQWNTATAGTGGSISSKDATSSICPKGWKLPSGGGSSKEINNLLGSVYAIGSNPDKAVAPPLYFVRGGNVASGNLRNAGNDSLYWTRTAYSNTERSYNLYFSGTGTVTLSDYSRRYYGMPIRCIAQQ